jgi:hypothetical protein
VLQDDEMVELGKYFFEGAAAEIAIVLKCKQPLELNQRGKNRGRYVTMIHVFYLHRFSFREEFDYYRLALTF